MVFSGRVLKCAGHHVARNGMLMYARSLVFLLHIKPPLFDHGGSMLIILPDPNHFPHAPSLSVIDR